MNRVVNPGWETAGATAQDAAGWTRHATRAYRYDAGQRSGSWGGVILRAADSLVPPIAYSAGHWEQVVPVVAGSLTEVALYAAQDAPSGAVARLLVDGSEVDRAADVGGWQRLSALVTPTSSTLTLRVDLVGIGGTAASWIVDDAEVEDVVALKKGMYRLFRALYDRVKEINGTAGGYWHDLGGRVKPRLVMPGQPGADSYPFACVVLRDEGSLDDGVNGAILAAVECDVYIWPQMNASDDIELCSAVDTAKWGDDLLRCLIPSSSEAPWWTLGEAAYIQDVTLVSKEMIGQQATDGGAAPAMVKFTVRMMTTLEPSVLGPEA